MHSGSYNYDGSLGSIDENPVNSGTSRDPWDTIDDDNMNGSILSVFPNANLPGTWTTDNFCGGIEASANDSNIWKDVTADGACTSAGEDCIFQDKISGLRWSELLSNGRTWPQALNDCDGSTLGGHTDWRLPTQKELLDAYNHGIRSAGTTNWMTSAEIQNPFWSASSSSSSTGSAWHVYLGNGYSIGDTKNGNPSYVVCVR